MRTDKDHSQLKRLYAFVLLLSTAVFLSACQKPEKPAGSSAPVAQSTSESPNAEASPAETDPNTTGAESAAGEVISHPIGSMEDDYILPDASVYAYPEELLSSLSSEELRVARNELYARHGRAFRDETLRAYFEGKAWYQAKASAVSDDSILNSFEKENLKRILRTEQRRIPLQIPEFSREEFPVLDGSTATLPISQALYRLVTDSSQEEAEDAIYHSKTTSSYRRLAEKDPYDEAYPSLVIAYEPSEELYAELSEDGDPLLIEPVGKDALVFMSNAENPVTSLTEEQLVDIYAGKSRFWEGTDGSTPIVAFQRPEGSGSQNLMEKLVMQGTPMAKAPSDQIFSEMGDILEALSSYDNSKNAIGYSVYYYARNMYEIPDLRFMAVNQILPDNDTIRDGSYPYVNEFYAAIRKDEPEGSPARVLFDWLTSDDGQALINELGYVGMKDVRRKLPDGFLPEDEYGTDSQSVSEETGKSPVVSLKKDQVLLADGNNFRGQSGTVIYDAAFKELDFLPDIATDGMPLLAAWDQKELIRMRDDSTNLYGIYSLEKKDWEIKPVYNGISRNKNGFLLYREVSGTGSVGSIYSFADPEGRIMKEGRSEDILKLYEKGIQPYPDMNAAEFASAYPELMKTYHASAADIDFWWPSDYDSQSVAVIRSGNVYHICKLSGELLFSMDAGTLIKELQVSSEEAPLILEEFSSNQTAPVTISDGIYCQRVYFYAPLDGKYEYYGWKALIFDHGKLVKTLNGDKLGGLIPGDGFYLDMSGNYISVYNYEDQLVKRVLNGDARND
ncbi:MAG: YARHG domain-containing protein [Eubacteriales bacterium]|nr:YARHG domain-containing protein [Eubacteriales bacterium]